MGVYKVSEQVAEIQKALKEWDQVRQKLAKMVKGALKRGSTLWTIRRMQRY